MGREIGEICQQKFLETLGNPHIWTQNSPNYKSRVHAIRDEGGCATTRLLRRILRKVLETALKGS